MIFQFYASYIYEQLHPLQTGVFRRKVRAQRRHGLRRENPIVFYPKRAWEMVATYVPALMFLIKLRKLRKRIEQDPAAWHYTDIAITPVEDVDEESLEMYQSESAHAALVKAKAKAEAAKSHMAREQVAGIIWVTVEVSAAGCDYLSNVASAFL
jgi:hypothetical protein